MFHNGDTVMPGLGPCRCASCNGGEIYPRSGRTASRSWKDPGCADSGRGPRQAPAILL